METPYHRRIFWSKKAGRGRIWTQHKVAGVLNSFKGETSIAQICQERWIAQARRFPRKPEKEARVTPFVVAGPPSNLRKDFNY